MSELKFIVKEINVNTKEYESLSKQIKITRENNAKIVFRIMKVNILRIIFRNHKEKRRLVFTPRGVNVHSVLPGALRSNM